MGRAGMFLSESEVPDLVRESYAKLRPDWQVLDISLVARRFGGFMAVVVCEKVAAPMPEGVARYSDEVCFVSPKGEVTCFTDIASFANFLIWYERRSSRERWLTLPLFLRCLSVATLVGATYGLDAALDGGSPYLGIGALVSVVCLGLLLIFQPAE